MEQLMTIDRMEGNEWVVLELEGGKSITLPRSWLPTSSREGDVIRASVEATESEAVLRVALDPQEKANRLGDAQKLKKRIDSGPAGDVSL